MSKKEYLLDTNICIFIIKRKPAQVKRMLNAHAGQVYVSALTVAELLYGANKSDFPDKNTAIITQLISRLPIIDFDQSDADEYGRVRAELEKRNMMIDPIDTQLAAQAKSRGLVMVTNNTSEFDRVSDLEIEDWASLG